MSDSIPTSKNVLGADVEIIGEVRFKTDLIIDGKIDGKVITPGALTIGENARIKGEVTAGKTTVYGILEGNLSSNGHCTLQPNCQVVGDIEAKSLTMTEGASFSGRSLIGTGAGGGGAAATPSPGGSKSS